MKNLLMKISLFLTIAASTITAAEIKDSSTGEAFPSQISFEYQGKKYDLEATGVATRKKFFVKVYSVASYLQGFTAGQKLEASQLINDAKAKQLTIKWVHDAPFQKVQEGYVESFQKSLDDSSFSAVQNDINTFIQLFNTNVNKGDEHILRWIPSGEIIVLINGKEVGHINNPNFAKALWSIWFGSRSVVDRERLLPQ